MVAHRPADRLQHLHDHSLVRPPEVPLPFHWAILASWGIALIEYCMAAPANRIGHEVYSTAELKTMQEVITLVVFAGFSTWVLDEPLTRKYALGFAFIALGAGVIFSK
jgi:hypothetical protein